MHDAALGANRIAESSFPPVKVFPLKILYPLSSVPQALPALSLST